MPIKELRKQVSVFVPISDWKTIQFEAARMRIPMTELCRNWMEPELRRLRKSPSPTVKEN